MIQATPATWRGLLAAGWNGDPRLTILCGGEALARDLAAALLQRCGALWNMYGPTETTIWSLRHKVGPGEEVVPIGRPLPNTRVYILDDNDAPVPDLVLGELLIAGDGLARGYRNDPELTAKKFVASSLPGAERLYRTGDQARYRPDGTIEFLGRKDNQVKIRGFRIGVEEVESALAAHPSIAACAVRATADRSGELCLSAYLTGSELSDSDIPAVRDFLRATLPAYMVPTNFTILAALPMTPNGKVDRKKLPDPQIGRFGDTVEPRDELETELAAIWKNVLDLNEISIHGNFFDLGGHSLLAAELFARIEERLGVTLPLATLFETPTIADLAGVLRGGTSPVPQRSLVAIRRGGSQPPLFAVPGVGGSVLFYQRLARLLGDDQPFYGLESQGVDGLAQPLTRIEDIAAVFLRAIRTVQSEGPYYLLGACIGGVVAWEIAQQLLVEGQEVGFFAMLGLPQQDSKARGGLGPRALAIHELMMGRLGLYGETFRRLRGRQRFEYLCQRISALSQLIRRRNWTRGNRDELYREIVTQANLLAFRRYAPRPYAGPVVVFRARTSDGADDYAPWRELAEGGVEVHTVPGDNSGLMLVEPHVQVVVAELKACLERARSTSSTGETLRDIAQ
jgi:thioesterase domain-containing protein/acyl carrier protein